MATRRARLWGALAGTLVMVFAIAPGALAAITRAPAGLVKPYPKGQVAVGTGPQTQPPPAAGPGPTPPGPVLYHGGPVLQNENVQVVYWAPSGFSFPAEYQTGMNRFMADLAAASNAGANVLSVAHQYVDADGPSLVSMSSQAPLTDTDPYPAGCAVAAGYTACVTDAEINSELTTFLVNAGAPTGFGRTYALLLPAGVDVCDTTGCVSTGAYCAYHSWWTAAGGPTTYTVLPYPGDPAGGYDCEFASGPNSPDVDSGASSELHELVEVATDPIQGSGYVDSSRNEVADDCAGYFAPVMQNGSGAPFNQTLNGDGYLLQDIWSDQNSSCLQSLGSLATAPVTESTAAAALNQPVQYSVTLTNDPAGATSYSWQYTLVGPAPQQVNPPQTIAATGPSATISFPLAGTYVVWATITDAGQGTITGVTRTNVDLPPRALFSGLTGVHAGTPDPFNATASLAGAGAITAYNWTFGDGATGTGQTIAHAYAKAGTYTVTLTVVQTDGQTATTTQPVLVSPRPRAHYRLRLSHVHGRYKLVILGRGFTPHGIVTIALRVGHRRITLHLRAPASGKFSITYKSRKRPHLLWVHYQI